MGTWTSWLALFFTAITLFTSVVSADHLKCLVGSYRDHLSKTQTLSESRDCSHCFLRRREDGRMELGCVAAWDWKADECGRADTICCSNNDYCVPDPTHRWVHCNNGTLENTTSPNNVFCHHCALDVVPVLNSKTSPPSNDSKDKSGKAETKKRLKPSTVSGDYKCLDTPCYSTELRHCYLGRYCQTGGLENPTKDKESVCAECGVNLNGSLHCWSALEAKTMCASPNISCCGMDGLQFRRSELNYCLVPRSSWMKCYQGSAGHHRQVYCSSGACRLNNGVYSCVRPADVEKTCEDKKDDYCFRKGLIYCLNGSLDEPVQDRSKLCAACRLKDKKLSCLKGMEWQEYEEKDKEVKDVHCCSNTDFCDHGLFRCHSGGFGKQVRESSRLCRACALDANDNYHCLDNADDEKRCDSGLCCCKGALCEPSRPSQTITCHISLKNGKEEEKGCCHQCARNKSGGALCLHRPAGTAPSWEDERCGSLRKDGLCCCKTDHCKPGNLTCLVGGPETEALETCCHACAVDAKGNHHCIRNESQTGRCGKDLCCCFTHECRSPSLTCRVGNKSVKKWSNATCCRFCSIDKAGYQDCVKEQACPKAKHCCDTNRCDPSPFTTTAIPPKIPPKEQPASHSTDAHVKENATQSQAKESSTQSKPDHKNKTSEKTDEKATAKQSVPRAKKPHKPSNSTSHQKQAPTTKKAVSKQSKGADKVKVKSAVALQNATKLDLKTQGVLPELLAAKSLAKPDVSHSPSAPAKDSPTPDSTRATNFKVYYEYEDPSDYEDYAEENPAPAPLEVLSNNSQKGKKRKLPPLPPSLDAGTEGNKTETGVAIHVSLSHTLLLLPIILIL